MKMKVYKGKPINVDVLTFEQYENSSLTYTLELNYKFVNPVTITVESPYPFYYAVFEDNTHWRTTDIRYVTNTKVSLTMTNQDIWSDDAITSSCLVGGSINTEDVDERNFKSNARSIETQFSNSTATLYRDITTAWKEYAVIQFSEPLEGALSALSLPYVLQDSGGASFTSQTYGYSVYGTTNATIECEYGGIYTYIIALDSVSSFLNLLTLIGEIAEKIEGSYINTRYIRVPEELITRSTLKSVNLVSSTSSSTVASFYNITYLTTSPVAIDTVTQNVLSRVLYGYKAWKIGEHYIYPMLYQNTYKLYMSLVIGVGTCYAIFHSGDKKTSTIVGNKVSQEIGFNLIPSVVKPSLYTTNNYYQDILNNMTKTQFATTSLNGLLMGIATLSPVRGTMMAVGGLANANVKAQQTELQIEREKFNRTTATNTNDVAKVLPYFDNYDVVYACEVTTVTAYNLMYVIANYNSYISYPETINYDRNDVGYYCEKVSNVCSPNKNSDMLIRGCIITANTPLLTTLNQLQ